MAVNATVNNLEYMTKSGRPLVLCVKKNPGQYFTEGEVYEVDDQSKEKVLISRMYDDYSGIGGGAEMYFVEPDVFVKCFVPYKAGIEADG